ncbi:AfsR/SARP family transcriptional regulator [Streptomyces cellulosae]|uniref:Transcriptional regulator n=1 Tax=Streptomyces cellulosae TaxID=1968 RepID=A0ABW7Y5R0_STRCE
MPARDPASGPPVGRLRIRLLGALEVTDADGAPRKLPPQDRRKLLLRLAVASDPVPVERLCGLLERDSRALYTLKRRLGTDGYEVEHVSEGYRLVPGRYSVDLHEFMDGVEALSPSTPVSELDRLARMWTGDPAREHDALPEETWQAARRGLRRLAEALCALPEAERPASAQALPRIFETDRVLRALTPAPPRKNLLIVDDTDADELGERLRGRYEVIPLKGVPQWRDFCAGPRLHGVDGALIDLHLDDRATSNGMEIIEHLCKHTRIPTSLVSAYPPAEIGELNSTFLQRYRLLRVVPKGKDGRDLYDRLDEVAKELLDDAPRYRLLRLKAELAHAVFRLEEERAHPRNRAARGSAIPWKGKQRRAEEAIDVGDVHTAARLVSEFCNEYGS